MFHNKVKKIFNKKKKKITNFSYLKKTFHLRKLFDRTKVFEEGDIFKK